MKKRNIVWAAAAAWLLLQAVTAVRPCAAEEAVETQKAPAASFVMKLRVLEGAREGTVPASRAVTASYLRYVHYSAFENSEEQALFEQVKRIFNLKSVGLVTEALLDVGTGRPGKGVHSFRIDGREYAVVLSFGRERQPGRFRVEVIEQPAALGGATAAAAGETARDRSSLLDTEFSLPEKNAAVFGFEDGAGRPYFIALRVVRPAPAAAAGPADIAGLVAQGTLGTGGALEVTQPPRPIKRIDPVYPEPARLAGVEGTVILESEVDEHGKVSAVRVLKSVPLLDQAAIEAVRQWIYEPVVIDGKPQRMKTTVTVAFRLDEKRQGRVGGVEGGVVGGVVGGVSGGVEGKVAGAVEGRVAGKAEGWPEVPAAVTVVVRPTAATPAAGVVTPQLSAAPTAAAIPSAPARPSVPPAAAPTQEELREFEKGAVRVEGKIKPPRLIKKVEPVYPPGQSGGGVVILMIRVDEKGAVEDALVLRPVPGLNEAALAAVKQWLYEPLILDGLARKAVMTVTVNFIPRGGGTAEALAKLDQGAVRVQGELKPPDLLKKVEPVYPETARLAGVEGTVILAVRARADGTVEDAIVLRSVPLLDQAAIDAVKQWVYAPFIVDGRAAPAVFTVTVNFKLK